MNNAKGAAPWDPLVIFRNFQQKTQSEKKNKNGEIDPIYIYNQ